MRTLRGWIVMSSIMLPGGRRAEARLALIRARERARNAAEREQIDRRLSSLG